MPLNSIQDLKGKTIAIERGSSKGDEFDNLIKTGFLTPKWTNNQYQNVMMVLGGMADVGISGPGKIGHLMTLKKINDLLGNMNQLMILPRPIIRDPNYLGISKELNQREFIHKFNHALNKGHETGVFQIMIENYINALQ